MIKIRDIEIKLLENFRHNIKTLRFNDGISQENLAHKLNISLRMYQELEAKLVKINILYANRIARYYNVSIDDLLYKKFDKININ
jgi:transcriptional regulator with XRE-family HTH domain